MKKILILTVCCVLAASLIFAGCAARETEETAAPADEETAATDGSPADEETAEAEEMTGPEEPILGGWTVYDGNRILLNDEQSRVFAEATETLTGEDMMPVTVVGKQVVSGTNYMFLCIGRPSVEELKGRPIWDMVSVYEDLKGKCELVSVRALNMAEPAAGRIYEEGPVGAWECAIDRTYVDGDAAEAFDKTSKEADGMKLTPAVLMGTQVVSGTNYMFLCKGETHSRDYACIVTVYADLEGNAEITDCTVLDIGEYYKTGE